jgi:hypothetical protein
MSRVAHSPNVVSVRYVEALKTTDATLTLGYPLILKVLGTQISHIAHTVSRAQIAHPKPSFHARHALHVTIITHQVLM